MALSAFDVWLLVAVVLLVLLNGFFVAAEFAIVKVRATQLATRAARGDARAVRARHVTSHLDAYLSATQLGITLASLGLGWIGEPAVARLLVGPLHAVGIVSEAAVHAIAFAVAFGTITLLHIVIGELAPKSLAIQRAEPTALWTAAPLHVFYVVFKPAIWALNGLANLILRGVGLPPATDVDKAHSEEELRLILAEAGRRKAFKKERADFLLRTFRLADLDARQAMTPRLRMATLDVRRPLDENLARAKEAGYSRFPVVDGSTDEVVGMVHYRDLHELAERVGPRELRAVLRPVHFTPATTSLEDALADMLRRGTHMAIVMDEFGSTAGLLTLEDIFEEVFGEIRDEFDVGEAPAVRTVADGHYVLDGQTPLHDVAAALGIELDGGEATTIGGFVVARLGRMPTKGERVRIGPYEATVREADRRRIQTLEVWRVAD